MIFKVLAIPNAVMHVSNLTLHYIVQKLLSNICKSVERAVHNITTHSTVQGVPKKPKNY